VQKWRDDKEEARICRPQCSSRDQHFCACTTRVCLNSNPLPHVTPVDYFLDLTNSENSRAFLGLHNSTPRLTGSPSYPRLKRRCRHPCRRARMNGR
jgi:hypothetical protein